MELPRISIIVPVYNVEPYIAECLQSVMNQTYQGPMECFMVDDCSTDRSMEIVERMIAGYEGSIEFSILHQEQNLGLSAARNTGIDVSSGDYVFFLDSDDVLSEDCIEYLISLIRGEDFAMIAGGTKVFYDDYDKSSRDVPSDVRQISGREFLFKWIDDHSSVISAWNKLYSIKYLHKFKVLFRGISYSEDVLFNFELFCRSSIICVSNKITYHYRKREGSLTYNAAKNVLDYIRNKMVPLWLELSRVNVEDGFDDLKEDYLYYYGHRIFALSKKNGWSFYHIFCLLHKKYPYRPLKMWLNKEKSFHWYKTRMMWSLPTLFGFFVVSDEVAEKQFVR